MFIIAEQQLRKWAKKKDGVAYREQKYAVMKTGVNNTPSTVISSEIFFFFLVIQGSFSQWSCHDFRTFSITSQLLLLFWLLTLLNHPICCTKASRGAPGVWSARRVLVLVQHWAKSGPSLASSSGRRLLCVLPLVSASLMKLISSRNDQFSASPVELFSRRSSCRITCRLSEA